MEVEALLQTGLSLMQSSPFLLLGTQDGEGYPNIKAMLNLKSEGMKHIWISTNTSSMHVEQLRNNPHACIYFVKPDAFIGLMLVGRAEVLTDSNSRRELWKPGFEVYYPGGIDDPDYCVIQFTAVRGNFYRSLRKFDFDFGDSDRMTIKERTIT